MWMIEVEHHQACKISYGVNNHCERRKEELVLVVGSLGVHVLFYLLRSLGQVPSCLLIEPVSRTHLLGSIEADQPHPT